MMMGFFGADFGPETSSAGETADNRPAASIKAGTTDFNELTFMTLLK
ncbi:hypothetical protein [Edaphobacter aggregans]|nr:hypothetical protein [Edaphobacter aggregans]